MMKALIFSIFMIIFITSGFMFITYVGCGGDFFNGNVGIAGGVSFFMSLLFSPYFFIFYETYVD